MTQTCKAGHPATPKHVVVWKRGNGTRTRCRICERERWKSKAYRRTHIKAVKKHDAKTPARRARAILRVAKLVEKRTGQPMPDHHMLALKRTVTRAELAEAKRKEAINETRRKAKEALAKAKTILPGIPDIADTRALTEGKYPSLAALTGKSKWKGWGL